MAGRKWTEKEDNSMIEFYGKIPTEEIAKKLDRTKMAIWKRAQTLGINILEKKFDKSPTPALAYILGVIEGDGSVGKFRKRAKGRSSKAGGEFSYRVQLQVVDREFAESFKTALEEIGLNPNMGKVVPKRENERVRWGVQASSKPFYSWHNGLFYDDIKSLLKSKRMKFEFLRGFYESEGTLAKEWVGESSPKSWSIHIPNTNKELILFVRDLLESLGFNFHYYEQLRKNSRSNRTYYLYLLKLGEFKEVRRFLAGVNPVIPRKSIRRLSGKE